MPSLNFYYREYVGGRKSSSLGNFIKQIIRARRPTFHVSNEPLTFNGIILNRTQIKDITMGKNTWSKDDHGDTTVRSIHKLLG